MDFADPYLGLPSTYWVISILISFLITSVVAYFLRQRSPIAVSYKTFGIIFISIITLFIMRKVL